MTDLQTLPAQPSSSAQSLQLVEAEFTELCRIFEVPPGLSSDELTLRGGQKLATATRAAVEAGVLFWAAKEKCRHVGTLESYEKMGVSHQRASECMRLAAAYIRTPAEKREQLISLPKTKVLMLTSLDSETADEILSSDNFADWMTKPRHLLAAEIAQLKQGKALADTRVETLQNELKTAAQGQPNLTKIDQRRRRQKLLAHGLAEISQRAANEAAKLVTDLASQGFGVVESDDVLADKAVCTGIFTELLNAQAAWAELVHLALQGLDGRISLRADDHPIMSKSEIFDARRRRAAMAEFTKAEFENITGLAYAQDALGGVAERGAPPKALKKIRKAGV